MQRDVVILHYYFGLQHTEIAQKLHLTPANTRKICSLALGFSEKKCCFFIHKPEGRTYQ